MYFYILFICSLIISFFYLCIFTFCIFIYLVWEGLFYFRLILLLDSLYGAAWKCNWQRFEQIILKSGSFQMRRSVWLRSELDLSWFMEDHA